MITAGGVTARGQRQLQPLLLHLRGQRRQPVHEPGREHVPPVALGGLLPGPPVRGPLPPRQPARREPGLHGGPAARHQLLELVLQVVDGPHVHDQVGEGQAQVHRGAPVGDQQGAPVQIAGHRERDAQPLQLDPLVLGGVGDLAVRPFDGQPHVLVHLLDGHAVAQVVGGAQGLVPADQPFQGPVHLIR
jgi:hypothetical protein